LVVPNEELHRSDGKFRPGHRRVGGRKKGRPNLHTRDIRAALLAAGESLGSDGQGTGGLTGFFMEVGRKKPEVLGGWISDLLPRVAKVDEDGEPVQATRLSLTIVGVPSGTFLSREEYEASAHGVRPTPLTIEHDDDEEAA
jgi:hypothetical protein